MCFTMANVLTATTDLQINVEATAGSNDSKSRLMQVDAST